jgi:xanthine dehydrogenase large subunit
MMAISVFEALRDAVAQARGESPGTVQLNAPATAENVLWAVQR